MSKWNDSLHKNDNDRCYCANDNGLFIPSRQLSCIIAGLLFMFFACFMGGYFYAKRTQATYFVQQMTQEAFDDDNHAQEPVITDEEAFEPEVIEQDTFMLISDREKEAEPVISIENNTESIVQPTLQFYAELIGFGTEKAAHAFVQKLSDKNIETLVKTRTSKTAKGRTIHWYQVVTPAYHDKEALMTMVSRLAKEERLKDINIKSC